jgi:predicted transcriptional regulator
MSSPDELIRFLTSSENRIRLLETLEDEPARPATLAEKLPMSRSSIQRNLRAFGERGWVVRTDDGYRCSFGGRLLLHRYRDLASTAHLTDEYGRFLDALADAGLALSPDDLEDVTITTATRHDPHAPLRWYADRVAEVDTTTFRGIAPVVSPLFNDAHRALISTVVDAELVIDEDGLSTSRTGYPEALATAIETDTLELYVHPDSLSFGLSLFDEDAFVGAYDDAGQFVACFEGSDDDFRERVRTVYEEHRAAARTVEPEELR